MRKFRFISSFTVIIIILSFIFYSCEDNDICTDEGEIPKFVADMYYTATNVKLEDTIYYWAYSLNSVDTVLIESGKVDKKSRFAIDITKNTNKKIFYTLAQGSDQYKKDENGSVKDTIMAKRDRLILEYDTVGNTYVSRACGYGLTFKDVKVTLVTKKTNGQGNWIKEIEIENTEIKDGSTPTIKLFADSRN